MLLYSLVQNRFGMTPIHILVLNNQNSSQQIIHGNVIYIEIALLNRVHYYLCLL